MGETTLEEGAAEVLAELGIVGRRIGQTGDGIDDLPGDGEQPVQIFRPQMAKGQGQVGEEAGQYVPLGQAVEQLLHRVEIAGPAGADQYPGVVGEGHPTLLLFRVGLAAADLLVGRHVRQALGLRVGLEHSPGELGVLLEVRVEPREASKHDEESGSADDQQSVTFFIPYYPGWKAYVYEDLREPANDLRARVGSLIAEPAIRTTEYEGWMVVEAEQDPAVANPFEYALKAREYIREHTGL